MDRFEECQEVHFVGEENTLFYIDCGIDVSQATETVVFIQRPDGTKIKKYANPAVYNGSPDWVSFIVAQGDFNQCGKYRGQAFVIVGAWSGYGQPFTIKVENPISSSSSSKSSSSSSSSSAT